MGILFALIAGLFVPITNLTVRKSVDIAGNTKAYFVFQMATSLLVALLLGPIRTWDFSIPLSVAILGILAGLVLSAMIFCLGRAITKGPPGFTFSILNAATLMPGMVMALLYGASFGFVYTSWHALGSLLVLVGLFWAGSGIKGMKEIKTWLFFATTMFVFHVVLLVLYQWRALLIKTPESFSTFGLENMESEWFTPFMFVTTGLIQLVQYLRTKETKLQLWEGVYGVVGGVTNILGTFFLLWAAQVAKPLENAVIFPIFSVVGIALTNLWGQKLYDEKVNWRACHLCLLGLFIGTIDWKALLHW